jgi:hypothetical protein
VKFFEGGHYRDDKRNSEKSLILEILGIMLLIDTVAVV